MASLVQSGSYNSTDYTNADLVTGSAGGNNILQVTPNFVSSINVRLNAASAAINAGFSYSGSIFLGASPDAGIYEFGGSD